MYYSPILFSKIANINLHQYQDDSDNINIDNINLNKQIIIYSLHSAGHLYKINNFIDKINKPFIIISAMEDTQLPLEIDSSFIDKLKKNIFFKHWFSINKTIPNDEYFTSIPYGLNYWTLTTIPGFGENIQGFHEQNMVLESIANNVSHFSQRIPKIYANFHHNFTDERHGGSRRALLNIIPSDIIFYEPKKLSRSESYKQTGKFSFVLSPFGHGFDCIRTFEALCLGCIVIMKKSFLDIIYEDLPILLVDEWTDVTQKLLEDTLVEFSKKEFNYNKLKMDYWINVINSKW